MGLKRKTKGSTSIYINRFTEPQDRKNNFLYVTSNEVKISKLKDFPLKKNN